MSEGGPIVTEVGGSTAFFRLPEYVESFGTFLSEVMHGFAASLDPILANSPRVNVRRMYRGRNSLPSTGTVDLPNMETRTAFSLSHDIIVGGDLDSFLAEMFDFAERYVSLVMPQVFANISMVTDAFGNTRDAGGAPFDWDMYLDMLDQMEVAFDENDNPVLPTLVVGIEFSAPEMTEVQKSRMEGILAAKRDAYLSRRRYRRIPRDSLRD